MVDSTDDYPSCYGLVQPRAATEYRVPIGTVLDLGRSVAGYCGGDRIRCKFCGKSNCAYLVKDCGEEKPACKQCVEDAAATMTFIRGRIKIGLERYPHQFAGFANRLETTDHETLYEEYCEAFEAIGKS